METEQPKMTELGSLKQARKNGQVPARGTISPVSNCDYITSNFQVEPMEEYRHPLALIAEDNDNQRALLSILLEEIRNGGLRMR